MATTPIDWINKIFYKTDEETEGLEKTFYIGTTFDKVFASEGSDFSLKNLATQLKNFFSKPRFMFYSTKSPNANSKTVEWYAITTIDDNVDSKLKENEE